VNLKILGLEFYFLNAQKMTTQSAIYLILSVSLYHCSCFFVFINTSPLQEQVFVLKPEQQLLEMNKESIDTMCKSIINKYIDREKCLAKFVANYNHNKKKNSI
jgi:hypothetical protein